ncbi:MAG: hypothetical protein JWM16_2825 [Verrucomicrobiales bacterium]|nr:hypothetical protein [Verrucomicrobiales bacterium]
MNTQLSPPQVAWLLHRRRRHRRQAGSNLWFHFRANDLAGGQGFSVPSIPDSNGGSVVLNSPSGGTPPVIFANALPNGQKALFFNPSTGVNRLDFNQNFLATSSTIIVVANATNVPLGDQGLVVCANTALYANLSASFLDHWGCYVKATVQSGYSLSNVFKVVILRVNLDASFDMFDMATKVSIGPQAGSFPGRPGASVGADPGGSQQFQGYIAEIYMYTNPLSDTDILAKVSELLTLYGI